MKDTSAEVEARYRAMLLAKPGSERVRMGAEEQRRLLFRRLYPELPPRAVPHEFR